MKPYLILAAALAVMVSPAQARDCVWREQHYACVNVHTGHQKTCTRWRCVYRNHYGERRYYSDDRRRDRAPARESTRRLTEGCKWQDRLRVTGTDKLDKKRAEVSAQDAWSSTVETRHGTLYSDIQNAEDLTVTCVRKVPSSIVERAQAAGGLRHYVCEISAVPCPPEVEEKDEDTRAKRRSERRSESPPSEEGGPARP